VGTLEHRNAGKISECRSHQVEPVACTRDARVRIEAGENRVAVTALRQRWGEGGVVPCVLEPLERNGLRLRARCAEGGQASEQPSHAAVPAAADATMRGAVSRMPS